MAAGRTGPRQAREIASKLGWLASAQAATGWAVIIIMAALLGAIYLNQASEIATIGRRVQQEQNALEEAKRINADLERQIAEAQSLERLNAEALSMGFVPAGPDDIDYIVIPEYPNYEAPLTLPTDEPEQTEVVAPPPETMLEALSLAFRSLTDALVRGQANEQ